MASVDHGRMGYDLSFTARLYRSEAKDFTGIVMTLTGIVQNYSGLLAARFFLGKISFLKDQAWMLTIVLA